MRLGELAGSATEGEVLVTVGLGSCIGLILADGHRQVAGLAHVMLPVSAPGAQETPGKYADTAVPALLAEMERLGARRNRLQAVLVGGAQMFALSGSGLDVGARNMEAVTAGLDQARVPIVAVATGGSVGRTVRVDVGMATVRVKEAGGVEQELWTGTNALLGSPR